MEMTEAHIVPDLAHTSLISTQAFCNAGCQVVFSEDKCRVYYNRKLVVVGGRIARGSESWKIIINPTNKPCEYKRTIKHLDLQISPVQAI